jgi:hypothetical protein
LRPSSATIFSSASAARSSLPNRSSQADAMRSYSETRSASVGDASSCASSTSRYFSDWPVFS